MKEPVKLPLPDLFAFGGERSAHASGHDELLIHL